MFLNCMHYYSFSLLKKKNKKKKDMYVHLDHLVFLHLLGLDENKDIQVRAEHQIALGDFRSHDKIGHSDAESIPSLKRDSIGQESNKAAKLNLSITSPRGKGGGGLPLNPVQNPRG